MAPRHVIVDGSNLATEGRSMPSLAQLDQAVREFIAENPTDVVTVVVDASFGHRIDPSEVTAFEEAEAAGEVVSPPAGAIGRGDAFLLRIAEKTGATVLSNDSFQEFHGEHTWLFDKGRLVGGKPVPGVGWIFMDRSPVRGAKSREVTKEAKRKKRELETGAKPAAADHKPKARSKSVDRAIARATEEAVGPKEASKSRRRRGSAPPAEPVNEPLAFITFIAAHPLGSDVVGNVLEYSSHGAFVEADGARCYIPLSAMGEPPPRRAREAVAKGEPNSFVVQAFDPQRRGIELALPGFARIAGEPTAETVKAEISGEPERAGDQAPARGRKRQGRKAAAEPEAVPAGAEAGADPAAEAGAVAEAGAAAELAEVADVGGQEAAASTGPAPRRPKKAAAKKVAVEKAPAAKKAAAEKVPAEKAPAAKKAAASKKASAEKVAAEKTPGPKKAAPAKKAPAKKAAAAAAAGDSGPGETVIGGDTGEPAKKAATKKAPADKVPAKKAAADKVPAKKVAAKKAPAKKAPAAKAGPPEGAPRQTGSPPDQSSADRTDPADPSAQLDRVQAKRVAAAEAARSTRKASARKADPTGTAPEGPGPVPAG